MRRPRPAITLSDRSWRAAIVCLLGTAVLLRLVALDLKPFHHDEGVNGFFLLKLARPPHVYRYDPANYHGPTLYYLAWAASAVFGLTTFALRLVPALGGVLTIALMLPLRRHLGDVATLVAMALLVLSPGAVFHSRYFIHESILVCATLGVVVGVLDHLGGRTTRGIMVAAMSVAMMTATKETWFISLGVMACAAAGTIVLCRISVPRAVASLAVPFRVIVSALVVLVGVNLLFYSSFFTNPDGLRDFFRAYDFWSKTGEAAHLRPWYGYVDWLVKTDLPLLVGGVGGALLAAWRRENALAVFAGLWGVGIVAAYSLIPYKTPWLILNFLPPFALASGYLVSWLLSFRARSVREVTLAWSGIALIATIYQSVALNFFRYDDPRSPYVYAQTSRETLALVRTVFDLVNRAPAPAPVVVMVPAAYQFPLPWYFRNLPAGYPGGVEALAEGVAIVTQPQEVEATRVLGERFVRVGMFELRPGINLVVFASSSVAAAHSRPD
jgi:uncharacterized protein (TIGR03663 family)